jgi:uncharacterized membrane protein
MRRTILMVGVLAALFASILAAPALAYTKAQAEQAASEYAQGHYGGSSSRASCTASGKNKKGEAQYYCSGTYNFGNNEYKVNVGPYGEITYHNP